MDEISELENRVEAAMDTIGLALEVPIEASGPAQEDIDLLNTTLAERDQKIDALTQQVNELTSKNGDLNGDAEAARNKNEELLAEIEQLKSQVAEGENKRKEDMAELDEIIDQLEPLLQGNI